MLALKITTTTIINLNLGIIMCFAPSEDFTQEDNEDDNVRGEI